MKGRYWKYYVEHELRAKNYKNVEQIFLRCLTSTPHIGMTVAPGNEWWLSCPTHRAARPPPPPRFFYPSVRCKSVPADLWNSYLSYVVATKRALADGYVLVLQAFEFALEHVGFDISSSQVRCVLVG